VVNIIYKPPLFTSFCVDMLEFCKKIKNKCKRKPKGQSRMDNSEKLATRRRQTQQNTCWTPAFSNTKKHNKTWALLQTTGGKDEQINVCMLRL
jgi:hypothetical protein